ncbi:MAG TPA: hypothetical protein VKC59_04165 [Candidatus Limnocylindrales bacterium]|nr:hypothetical protein [Candidatus Limnocylindrales bacterium]
MNRTHLSLYYLASYLPIAGLALLLAPDAATKLLLSNATYDDVFTRLAGVLLLALGALIIQIVRHRVEVLYTTTVVVRVGLLAVLAVLFARTADPFFLVLVGVVGLGVVLTGTGLYLDRRSGAA